MKIDIHCIFLYPGVLENSTIKKNGDIQATDMVKIAYASCIQNGGT